MLPKNKKLIEVALPFTKALIEIPPKFAGKPPVNPESRRNLGASGS